MPTKKADTGKKTYILTLRDNSIRKVTVPNTWKLTYGSAAPFVPGKGYPPGDERKPYALRFYEGSKENLRAVFTDVLAFRDADMEIMEKRVQVKRQNAQKQTPNGARAVVVEARVSEWVNPDDEESDMVDDSFLQLPPGFTEDE